ncbi:MAG: BamA/TamA family outer membrane protein [Pseudomonadota bacterium]
MSRATRLQTLLLACALWGPLAMANETAAETAPEPLAFELSIQADDEDIAHWMAQHLELQRYKNLSDLDDQEMAKLLRDADVQARDLLATLGYFNPQLRWKLGTAPSAAYRRSVDLDVTAGPTARITQVQIQWQGDMAQRPETTRQREQVIADWGLPKGQDFSQVQWQQAKSKALQQVQAERYPQARIVHSQARVDAPSNQVQLSLTIDSGPLVKIGPLVITGAERYSTEQVERLAHLTPGDIYQQNELLLAQQRLVVSGFYDAVFVSLDTEGPVDAMPVKVELKEALRQKWVLGLGIRSDSGPRLTAEYTQHRVPGLDWRAVTKLSVDKNLQTWSLDMLAPPDANLWRWNGSSQLEHQQFEGYAVNSQRWRYGRTQHEERTDRSYYAQFDASNSSGSWSGQREAISGNYAWTWRRFDSLPFPTQGLGGSLELGAGMSLGAQREPFTRWLARGMLLQPLGRASGRLALRAEMGSVISRDTTGLPTTQLFVAGGDNSVRGYATSSIGVVQSNGAVAAGRYLATGSVEWQRPIRWNQQRTDWETAVFVDAGAVSDDLQQMKAQIGYGVGARWRSPIGPLRMDLAYGQAIQKLRLHLSVGFVF